MNISCGVQLVFPEARTTRFVNMGEEGRTSRRREIESSKESVRKKENTPRRWPMEVKPAGDSLEKDGARTREALALRAATCQVGGRRMHRMGMVSCQSLLGKIGLSPDRSLCAACVQHMACLVR